MSRRRQRADELNSDDDSIDGFLVRDDDMSEDDAGRPRSPPRARGPRPPRPPRLSAEQKRRVQRMRDERFYVLDVDVQGDEALTFDVSGSTGNVYHVRLQRRNGAYAWQCSCPDAHGRARRAGVLCKHVCFVVAKVMCARVDAALVVTRRGCATMDEWTTFRHRADSLRGRLQQQSSAATTPTSTTTTATTGGAASEVCEVQDAGLRIAHESAGDGGGLRIAHVNAAYRERYLRMRAAAQRRDPARLDQIAVNEWERELGVACWPPRASAPHDADAARNWFDAHTAVCSVCFDDLVVAADADDAVGADASTWIVRCATCRHVWHLDCIDRWLDTHGDESRCVMCRAPLPYAVALRSNAELPPTMMGRRARRGRRARSYHHSGHVPMRERYMNVAAASNV